MTTLPSRRSVLAASASSALAIATPSLANSPSGLGVEYERLLIEFFEVDLRYRALEGDATATANKKLGHNWRDDSAAGHRFYDSALEENGSRAVYDRYNVLHDRLTDLADRVIKPMPTLSIDDLRAKTLVVLFEAHPFGIHGGELEEYDGGAARTLFDAAAAITGLTSLVERIERGMAEDAALYGDEEQE